MIGKLLHLAFCVVRVSLTTIGLVGVPVGGPAGVDRGGLDRGGLDLTPRTGSATGFGGGSRSFFTRSLPRLASVPHPGAGRVSLIFTTSGDEHNSDQAACESPQFGHFHCGLSLIWTWVSFRAHASVA